MKASQQDLTEAAVQKVTAREMAWPIFEAVDQASSDAAEHFAKAMQECMKQREDILEEHGKQEVRAAFAMLQRSLEERWRRSREVHRGMSTTMRRARLALAHSIWGSAGDAMNELGLQKWLKNNRQEMKRLLDCLSPRTREVVEDHDTRQTNLMRWQLAAAVSKRQLAEAVL